jgi:hypothetical protein
MHDLTTSLDIKLTLLDALQNGTLIALVAGSAPPAGGFAWVLAANEDSSNLLHGCGYTGPSPFGITCYRPTDQDSSARLTAGTKPKSSNCPP